MSISDGPNAFRIIEEESESSPQGERAGWLCVLSKSTWQSKLRQTKTNRSALLVGVTQLPKAVTDRVPHTEPTEEPVIGMPAAVVDGSGVATVVIAMPAGRGRGTLEGFRLGRSWRRGVWRHLVGTGGPLVLIEVEVFGCAPREVPILRRAGRVTVVGLWNLDGHGRSRHVTGDSEAAVFLSEGALAGAR